ncbi:hypothetical protein ACFTZF_33920 [Streptomyces mirabilis]|uniref:hypothetical protein n=1 Tax=Streptomyces mirabilis TaxID=68239 RepID=UPI00363E3549
MALNATALITAAAATEYAHYVKVREELRHPAPSTPTVNEGAGSAEPGTTAVGLTATMEEVTETAGAGAFAVVAVLAPVLTGTAAAIFLLVGFLLKVLTPELAFAQALLTAGWVFGAVAAAAVLVAVGGLLLTALRGRPSREAGPYGELSGEVARAGEAWREALLERGILPFLREALADQGTAALSRPSPTPTTARVPHLGYNRPGFSSPDNGPAAGPRPSFTSPDYTNPDFGGPDFAGPTESGPSTGPENSD